MGLSPVVTLPVDHDDLLILLLPVGDHTVLLRLGRRGSPVHAKELRVDLHAHLLDRRQRCQDLVDGVKLRCTYISAYTKYGTPVMRRTQRPQRVEQPWDLVDYYSRGYPIDRDDADW